MADHAEVIRQQMAETRASMTEKIEALEKQVTETVKETTETVSDTVDTATEAVKDTVEAVTGTVEAVKETFDISAHFQNYPWIALGGSVALGYVLGAMLLPSSQPQVQTVPVPVPTPVPTPTPSTTSCSTTSSALSSMSSLDRPASTATENQPVGTTHHEPSAEKHPNLSDVYQQLKGLAIGTAVSLLGEMVMKSIPNDLAGNFSGLFKQLTEALGGKPVHRSGSPGQ